MVVDGRAAVLLRYSCAQKGRLMNESSSPNVESGGCLGLLFRLYWIGLGNFPLIFLPIAIVRDKTGDFSLYDILFVLAALSVLAARYVDIRYFKGETADNKPATLAHWWKHALKLSVLGVAALALSHALALFLAS